MRRTQSSNQQGFVSLFTVIFFMLLITIITVGFLRIMAAEQRQSLDHDLTASAEAAAQSGIEDAKRAILKYNSLPDTDPLKAQLATALTSTSCNALFSSAAIRTALNLNANGSINNQSGLNEYNTCLSVDLTTADYVGSASTGKSEFIPLKAENNNQFEQIMISWHLASQTVGTDGDGQPGAYAPGLLLPPVTGANSWSTGGYPAYLRVEVFGYPQGNFNRSNIDSLSKTVFLVPNASNNAAAVNSATPIDLGAVDPRGADQTKLNLIGVRCNGTPPNVPIGTYACSARLQLQNGQPSTSNQYYLRVTPLYSSTHFRVQMLHNSSTVVNFNGVEPLVDSTGRASDVFRRIQSRIRLDSTADLPEYSVESAGDICKTMQVSDGSYYRANSCP